VRKRIVLFSDKDSGKKSGLKLKLKDYERRSQYCIMNVICAIWVDGGTLSLFYSY